jgi:hypothetical protein
LVRGKEIQAGNLGHNVARKLKIFRDEFAFVGVVKGMLLQGAVVSLFFHDRCLVTGLYATISSSKHGSMLC